MKKLIIKLIERTATKERIEIIGLVMNLILMLFTIVICFINKAGGLITVLPDTEITNEKIADISNITWFVVFSLFATLLALICKLICYMIYRRRSIAPVPKAKRIFQIFLMALVHIFVAMLTWFLVYENRIMDPIATYIALFEVGIVYMAGRFVLFILQGIGLLAVGIFKLFFFFGITKNVGRNCYNYYRDYDDCGTIWIRDQYGNTHYGTRIFRN